MRTVANIFWILCAGIETALCWAVTGLVLCLTVIGIPVGLQCFKMAKLSLMPFGSHVTYALA